MKIIKRLFGLLLIGGICAMAAAYWWMNIYSNFHAVIDHEIYRSAQLSPAQLKHFSQEKKLAGVINLRGAEPEAAWWIEESEYCKQNGIAHQDFAWNDRTPPTREQLETFIETCRTMPKPLLIHCRYGADRTSLGCALYLHHIEDKKETEARRCYRMRFGHVPWLFAKVRIWDELFFARDD